MLEEYGPIKLANIAPESPDEIYQENADYMRVEMPANAEVEIAMQDKGFYWVDRTLHACVHLVKIPDNLEKYVRLPIEESCHYKEDILRIAASSFTYDRRFHVSPHCDKRIATMVLHGWIQKLHEVLICKYKDQVIGFLALRETSDDTLFVHLAAVDEKFRLTGAAMALYAKACLLAKERQYKKLEGHISTQNTAVMNIYATLGAVFSHPMDIFLKK